MFTSSTSAVIAVSHGMRSYQQDRHDTGFLTLFAYLTEEQRKPFLLKIIADIMQDLRANRQDISQRNGSTLCLSILINDKVYVVNLGDSECLIASKDEKTWTTQRIHTLHDITPSNYKTIMKENDEKQTIDVQHDHGYYRIIAKVKDGDKVISRPDINMYASVGDFACDSSGLKHIPDITVHSIPNKKHIMISASDGLRNSLHYNFNVSTEDTINYLLNKNSNITKMVEELRRLGSDSRELAADNLTIIAYEYKPNDLPTYMAVYDGHGIERDGHLIAEYLVANMNQKLQFALIENFLEKLSIPTAQRAEFTTRMKNILNNHHSLNDRLKGYGFLRILETINAVIYNHIIHKKCDLEQGLLFLEALISRINQTLDVFKSNKNISASAVSDLKNVLLDFQQKIQTNNEVNLSFTELDAQLQNIIDNFNENIKQERLMEQRERYRKLGKSINYHLNKTKGLMQNSNQLRDQYSEFCQLEAALGITGKDVFQLDSTLFNDARIKVLCRTDQALIVHLINHNNVEIPMLNEHDGLQLKPFFESANQAWLNQHFAQTNNSIDTDLKSLQDKYHDIIDCRMMLGYVICKMNVSHARGSADERNKRTIDQAERFFQTRYHEQIKKISVLPGEEDSFANKLMHFMGNKYPKLYGELCQELHNQHPDFNTNELVPSRLQNFREQTISITIHYLSHLVDEMLRSVKAASNFTKEFNSRFVTRYGVSDLGNIDLTDLENMVCLIDFMLEEQKRVVNNSMAEQKDSAPMINENNRGLCKKFKIVSDFKKKSQDKEIKDDDLIAGLNNTVLSKESSDLFDTHRKLTGKLFAFFKSSDGNKYRESLIVLVKNKRLVNGLD